MSSSHNIASSEFADLCQSQIKLLTQGLGAIWSAVYLTREVTENQEKQLLLFTIYPLKKSKLPAQITERELPNFIQQIATPLELASRSLLSSFDQENNLVFSPAKSEGSHNKQLILPLIHEETMMGLLITKREDRYWNEQELEQVKAIAQTLAIARFIEQQSQWYQKQFSIQQSINRWQQEQFGDLLHQLRNPLTALRTFSKLLLKRLLPENRNQSLAENILAQGDRLEKLIDRFAAEVEDETPEDSPVTLSTTSVRLAEIETKQPHNFLLPGNTTKLENVDIKKLLGNLIDTAIAVANNKQINLVTDIPPYLPLVVGNISALTEVLNNLLDNAVKYTPEQGQITVRVRLKDDLLGIAIEDTGYGIPEADREHLFERHYRGVQAQGDIPGTGLGLAIAKQLVEQMQGSIEVISPNNFTNNSKFPGTIFILWLSIAQSVSE